jgi:hypothetical protein
VSHTQVRSSLFALVNANLQQIRTLGGQCDLLTRCAARGNVDRGAEINLGSALDTMSSRFVVNMVNLLPVTTFAFSGGRYSGRRGHSEDGQHLGHLPINDEANMLSLPYSGKFSSGCRC